MIGLEDMYPLRKRCMDYRQRPAPTTETETYPFVNEGKQDARVVPIGLCILRLMNRDISVY